MTWILIGLSLDKELVQLSSITTDEEMAAFFSCRRLWGARPRLLGTADDDFDSHLAATLFYHWSRCWPTSAHWTVKSNKKLSLLSPAPAKPSNRHCLASCKCCWTEVASLNTLKSPRDKNGNGMTPDEPYLGIRGVLESGGGYVPLLQI